MTLPTNSGPPHPGAKKAFRWKWLLFCVVGLGLACCCLMPRTRRIREGEGWVGSADRLKWIGLAMQAYVEATGHLPPAVVKSKDGRPLYSWRVEILPFLEQKGLYDEFHLDEPWDSPHNKPLTEMTPSPFRPRLYPVDASGLTRYQVFVGPGTAFERDGLTWADFPDGRAHTLLVVEAGEPVPWSKPVDLVYDPGKPLPPLGGAFDKADHFLGIFIGRKPGFTACFADGSARFIRSDTDEAILRALITRNGGEPVDMDRVK